MQITITATLTDSQALILTTEKWYNKDISTMDINNTLVTSTNPQSPFEFLKSVYESMIIQDATKNFIQYDDRQNQALWLANEEAIKASVIASISSSVV